MKAWTEMTEDERREAARKGDAVPMFPLDGTATSPATAELAKWRAWAMQLLGCSEAYQSDDEELRNQINAAPEPTPADAARTQDPPRLEECPKCRPGTRCDWIAASGVWRCRSCQRDMTPEQVAAAYLREPVKVVIASETGSPAPGGPGRDLEADPPETPHPHDQACSRCGARLVFSARRRGDGLCGPCSRLTGAAADRATAPARTTTLADRCRAAGLEPSLVLEILRSPEGRAAIAECVRGPLDGDDRSAP